MPHRCLAPLAPNLPAPRAHACRCLELGTGADDALLLSVSLDEWLQEYSADPNAAIVNLANAMVYASGLRKVTALDLGSVRGDGEEDPLDELLNEARCAEVVEEAQARKSYLEPYPLADRKTGKRFKQALTRLVEALLEKIKHEVVYDQVRS